MKKIFEKIIILTIFCLIILTSQQVVHAASASITASKTSITVGESVTIRVNMVAASWNLHVSGSTSKSIVGYSEDGENVTKTQTISFKPKAKGTYKIILSGDVTDGKTNKTIDVSGGVTINVKEKSSTSNNNSSSNNSGHNNTASNNSNSSNNSNPAQSNPSSSSTSNVATLKNLGITPNDFSGFRAATTSYSVKVPNSVSKVNIYAMATSSKATVSGTGTKDLKEGKNTFSIKVTAEDKKTTKTYTLNITREEKGAESNDATLKNFGMRPNDFSGFKSGNANYLTEVPNSVSKINIYAIAANSKVTVSGTGTKNLKEGKNTFSVKVTAEDKKTTKTYTLVVVRKEKEDEKEKEPEKEPEENDNDKKADGLTNIEVSGYTISPRFNNEIYEYNLDIEDETKLDIRTDVSSSSYEVEIVGNEKFDVGENVITILVRNIKNDKVTTYQLIANVAEKEIDVSSANNVIANAQNVINKKQWIIIGAIVVIILLIIVFIIYKSKLRRNKIYDDNDYDENIEKDRINLDEEDIFNRMNNNFSSLNTQNNLNTNNIAEDELPNSFNFPNRVKLKDENFEVNNIEMQNEVDGIKTENAYNGNVLDNVKDGIKENDELDAEIEKMQEKIFDFGDTTLPQKEDHELDDFENLDNLEEILRKRKSEK